MDNFDFFSALMQQTESAVPIVFISLLGLTFVYWFMRKLTRGPNGLRLKKSNAWLLGVCSGIAERLDVSRAWVRFLFVLVLFMLNFLGVAVYLVFWFFMRRAWEEFDPQPGMLLICDFDTGFRKPEMIKKRPVVVISPQYHHKNLLYTVVPLSTTAPDPPEQFHHRLDESSLPDHLARKETWAKCDMVATVSKKRFDRVLVRKNGVGKKKHLAGPVTREDLRAIRRGVVIALGLDAGLGKGNNHEVPDQA